MLSYLYIKNIAVIEEASIDFSKGFTVLTGETGAGKSIIIDSISAILGQRISKDIVRSGCDKAVVTALFNELDKSIYDKLSEFNIEIENDELLIYREIKITGKTACKINGVPVTTAMLKELGVLLISIQGQHDSYELVNEDIHGKYIDNYGKLNEILIEYKLKYNLLKDIKSQVDALNVDNEQKERRIDFLKYQIEEIEDAQVEIGEKELLEKKQKIISSSENIARAVFSAKSCLQGEDDDYSISDILDNCATALEKVGETMPQLDEIAQKLRDIEYDIEDIGSRLSNISEGIEFSAEEQEQVEERLNVLYRLSLKYGNSEEQILNTLEKSKLELETIEMSDERLEQLSKEFEIVKNETITLAKQLSKKRKEVTTIFSEKVKEELKFLNMPNIEFEVKLERTNLNANGCDKINFLVSPNAGEQLKPMAKIASGGELSRIMLAIKTVLSDGDSVGTLIFDEIDAGISGDTANKVGQTLKKSAVERQLICITHLAQMAVLADNHLFIEKQERDGKTFTGVRTLSEQEKKQELTRIIGGIEVAKVLKTD